MCGSRFIYDSFPAVPPAGPGCAPGPPPPPLAPTAFGATNPFASTGGWYVNPLTRANMQRTLSRAHDASAAEQSALLGMADSPTAIWIDTAEKVRGAQTPGTLEWVLASVSDEAARQEPDTVPQLCVFVLYNLPHRDCSAKASAGGLSGLRQYKEEYIDPFAEVLHRYRHVPAVVIVEPDSLGNLVTNGGGGAAAGGGGSCGEEVAAAYRDGVSYAVHTLAARAPHAALYVDAAHGGWLGYEENAAGFVSLIRELGIAPLIRGFSTNIANYQPLGEAAVCPSDAFDETGTRDTRPGSGYGFRGVAHWCRDAGSDSPCCAYDPCKLLDSYGGGATEIMYAQTLQVRRTTQPSPSASSQTMRKKEQKRMPLAL
jgi:cellulose 1,4-beta-cellobiosidase